MFGEKLKKYLPLDAHKCLNNWCAGYKIRLVIKDSRKSKLGDYRKLKSNIHEITFNTGMGKELTFFTLTHEIAHMHARDKFGNHIKPHGVEWKSIFANLIIESISLYPKDLQPLLYNFSKNPKASFYASVELANYFLSDEGKNELLLKDIPEKTIFRIKEKIFLKGKIRKIRYLCTEISSKRQYSIHMLAPIDEIFEQ